MDYEFFHSLTIDQARMYLARLLEVEHQELHAMEASARSDGIAFDYSIATLSDVLKWMVNQVHMHHVPVPEDEPEFIRRVHPDGLLGFDEDSKSIVLRAGYYMGECFARLPGKAWTTGDPEYIHKHMPVVSGFHDGDELPPLVVVENIFARIANGDKPPEEIDATIACWLEVAS